MNYTTRNTESIIGPGTLLHMKDGQTALILEIIEEDLGPLTTNYRGITHRRGNWTISFLFGNIISTERLYFRHNSYQITPDIWSLATNPDWVRRVWDEDTIVAITTAEGDHYELDV